MTQEKLTGAARMLIEVGVEELPAPWLTKALEVLPGAVGTLLDGERLAHGAIEVLGTPRRVAILVEDLAEAQPEQVKDVTGPPERVGVDPETGEFTKPAIKFAERFGLGPGDIEIVEGPKGRVVKVTVRDEGKTAGEVIAAHLGELFSDRTIPYKHSMYWNVHTGPFIRPVHWLVVLHGDRVVDATLFDVSSSRETRGHRFHSKGPVSLPDAGSYEAVLLEHRVMVDPASRHERVTREIARCAEEAGARLVEDAELVDEVVALTEQPVPVLGGFDEGFLEIPEDVVITAMAVHQRYFALRDPESGSLVNRFIAVSNTDARDHDAVRRGYERVLAARLADARFCWEEDRKTRLEDLVPALEGMVYQRGLGTYLDKTRRLEALAPEFTTLTGGSDTDAEMVREAARLCKADLLTKVVYEFPELQGIMGHEYAIAQGRDEAVAGAIRDHYRPEGPSDALPGSRVGLVLSLADKIDTLTGFFGMGRRPRGGSDPFGLRRACLAVVRILLALDSDVEISRLVVLAHPLYTEQKLKVTREEIVSNLLEFLDGRLRVLWREDARGDILDAALACGVDSVGRARKRLDALADFSRSEEFEDLSVAFKRAYRIVKDEESLPEAPDPGRFEEDEERDLWQAVTTLGERVSGDIENANYLNVFNEFRKLRGPVDAFFDRVYVNVEDADLRRNRLAILGRIVAIVEPAARLDLVQFTKTKLESA